VVRLPVPGVNQNKKEKKTIENVSLSMAKRCETDDQVYTVTLCLYIGVRGV